MKKVIILKVIENCQNTQFHDTNFNEFQLYSLRPGSVPTLGKVSDPAPSLAGQPVLNSSQETEAICKVH